MFEDCAYCGARSTGRDHVPPKNLFVRDGSNLITVPACDDHNNKRSGLDERFREFVMIAAPHSTPATTALWEPTLRGIRRNPIRRAALISSMSPIPGTGFFLAQYEASVFHEMIENITRGLYWHHFQKRLPTAVTVECRRLRLDTPLEAFPLPHRRRICGDQFLYAYGRMESDPTVSSWLYLFHRKLMAWALTDSSLANQRTNNFLIDDQH